MNECNAGLSCSPHPLASAYFRHRYAILFYSLILTMVAAPLLKTLGFDANRIALLLVVNLVAAVIPIGTCNLRRLLLGIVFIAWAVRFTTAWLGRTQAAELSLGVWTVVALLAAANALRFVLRSSSIDSEHLYAALSVYLLAGIFFGVFYWLLEITWPGSLVIAGQTGSDGFKVVNGMYFSFVTLATVGYGDIVPRSELARGCAIFEAIGGQFYIAVMIARLVSLYTIKAGRQNPS
jgi:hypothetical protein